MTEQTQPQAESTTPEVEPAAAAGQAATPITPTAPAADEQATTTDAPQPAQSSAASTSAPAEASAEPSAQSATEAAPQEDAAPQPAQPDASSSQAGASESAGTASAAETQPAADGERADNPPADGRQTAEPAAPTEPEIDPEAAMDAAKWGRVDGEGRVYVQDGGSEREVGQFPGVPIAEAMAYYVRRYLDLNSNVGLFAARLPHLSVREIDSTIKNLEESLKEPAAVGDLEALRARFAALKSVAVERRQAVAAERAAAKEQALKDRTAIVERAEAVAAQDPARTQWKSSGAELRTLLEQWKEAQRRGPRLDRPSEDALWKRFSHARTTFDRHRRQYFSELDAKQAKVKAAKEALIKRAEELSHSTDWAGTSARYRELMDEWKKAGRASRKEDDALWERFHAAQQVFYDARRAKDEATDAEYAGNLKVKEELAAKAEALLPIKNPKAARKALRPIQEAWDEAGRVPRNAVRRLEARMRAVEDALRRAEQAEWRRTDPETQARAQGLASQLEDSIAELEADLAAAKESGDTKAQAQAEAALTARRAWLDQVRRTTRA
ncbi:DUF349 domain-containing protein [Actinomyces glycerinitolerans]|uniref:DUF349 domain-containing protein n=1 Tax=Actinomyces glycerinitolerans TaxID=1892869 RepID=A0A1M4S1J7_9ACTO|nr:DUF349 domain-containing protein [Actinomyces glycerinitolerans]SHE26051.1 Hypothetical protein ACGLYG10_2294 [Actinomyces glycerinitolerans]